MFTYDFTRWNTSWARKLGDRVELVQNASHWWHTQYVGEYLPVLQHTNPSVSDYLKHNNLWTPVVTPNEIHQQMCPCCFTKEDWKCYICSSLRSAHDTVNGPTYRAILIALFGLGVSWGVHYKMIYFSKIRVADLTKIKHE